MLLQGGVLELEPGAAPVTWNVQLDITAAPAARLGWARAPGLALDLYDSNDLAYQDEGVQTLKLVQNMIIRNFTSATCRRIYMLFNTSSGIRAVTLLHEKIQLT